MYQRRERSKSRGESNTLLDSTSTACTLWRATIYVADRMELLLIRHALPVRIEGEEGTAADPELAELGHEQSTALAAYLAGEHIDELYVSPLRRALQTAEPVAAQLGLEMKVDEELAE